MPRLSTKRNEINELLSAIKQQYEQNEIYLTGSTIAYLKMIYALNNNLPKYNSNFMTDSIKIHYDNKLTFTHNKNQ